MEKIKFVYTVVLNFSDLGLSCDEMIPANISAQPMYARAVILSPRIIAPPTALKSDSLEQIIAANEGSTFFCPITWRV